VEKLRDKVWHEWEPETGRLVSGEQWLLILVEGSHTHTHTHTHALTLTHSLTHSSRGAKAEGPLSQSNFS